MRIFKRAVLVGQLQALLPIVFLASLALYAIWPWLPLSELAGTRARSRTIVLYGFSILGAVIDDAVFPAFQQEWQAQTGEHVELISSFAGSGTVTNQLSMGVPAQLALLSLELDATRLAAAGVVPPQSWHKLPHNGIVNRTPFIILVRPGNPKNIRGFADLARPGIGVVHPDPLQSGGANWAIVAEYGAGLRANAGQPEAGYELVRGIWRNVVVQAPSARAARTQFESGFGDALITYEQEALWDKARGKLTLDVVYPRSTILSEHTLVVVDRNIAPDERGLVNAFAAFLWSDKAQQLFVQFGFRSVDERLNAAGTSFGTIADPFLIDAYGGWQGAKRDILDGVWQNRVLKELGK